MSKNNKNKKKSSQDQWFEEEGKKGQLGEGIDQAGNWFSSGIKKIRVGDRIQGEILSLNAEEAIISLSGPLDAVVSASELRNEKGELKFKVGDKIEIVVIQIREDVIRAKSANSRSHSHEDVNLEDAYDMEWPVEGRVLEAIKGGFRVQIQGQRAFCPLSHMSLTPIKDTSEFINKKWEFIITQWDEKQSDIVVSRKRLLELKRADQEGELVAQLHEGDLIDGKVSRLENFGAFIEIAPLVEGLVHVSEISWARVKHPAEVLEVGRSVKVKVLKIQEMDHRLQVSLSLKQGGGESDPWMQFVVQNPLGARIQGTISKKETFGYFIQLATGVNGLLHRSKWRDSLEVTTIENKKVGDLVWVEIDKIDVDQHQIGLKLPDEGVDQSWREHATTIEPKGSFGTFASLFNQIKK